MKQSKTTPHKGQEENKKWKDPNEQVKYICQGAKVRCKYCDPPIAPLTVTAESILLQDKPWATTGDKDGKVNFGFTGVCKHPSQQKPFCSPPPCKSVISLGEWRDYSDTTIGGHNALLVKSKIPCMVSGEDIEIVHSGQVATLEQISPLDFEKRITDVYWVDETTDEKYYEVMEGKELTLHILTRGYKEGEVATVRILPQDGATFANGKTEVTASGTVNAEDMVIVENFKI
jgi:hypothetical protein